MSAQIITASKKTEFKFTTVGPLYVPFYNKWGKNVYWQTAPFCLDPIHLDADSTSGSPVLVNNNLFIGFLNDVGGTFAFDGVRTLTLTLHPGQTVMIDENCNPFETWKEYNSHFAPAGKEQKTWQRLEYCTWVEQTKQAKLSGSHNYHIINEKFVYNYLERIEKMGLPKGKFTIDEGWTRNELPDGSYTNGDIIADPKKFPHLETLIRELTEAGYTPGLWFNPFCVTPDTEIAKTHPELLSDNYYRVDRKQKYFRLNEELLRPYYHDIFAKYIGMGIKKLKIDIGYSKKSDMIGMLRIISEEVRKLDDTVEIESHFPDIFAAPYCDAVRMNDVSIDSEGTWKAVTTGHFDVCHLSVPHKILNLDHIGSNAGLQSAEDFMAHWHLLRGFLTETKSYPVISFLPDIYTDNILAQFCDEINEIYDKDGYRHCDAVQ